MPGTHLACAPQCSLLDADSFVEYSLKTEDIENLSLYVPPLPWKPDGWYPFQQRGDGSFMLHPLGDRATTLQLLHGCPPGVERITAVVKITSPQARGDVQYAIAASNSPEGGELLDLTDLASDPRFLAFSGWQLIPRDDAPHVLALDFAEPLVEPAHLILATRMPPGVDHAWAWADWLEVRLRVRGLWAPRLEAAVQTRSTRAA